MEPYDPTNWAKGQRVSATKLNHLEQGTKDVTAAVIDIIENGGGGGGGSLTPEQSDAITEVISGRLAANVQQVNGQDLNNIVKTGFYAGAALINAPGNNQDPFYILVQAASADRVRQSVFQESGTSFQRYLDGDGTWNSWVQLGDDKGAVDKAARDSLSAKVDVSSATNGELFRRKTDGTVSSLPYSQTAENNKLVQRRDNAQIAVPETPNVDGDAASKKYVDNKVGTTPSSRDFLAKRPAGLDRGALDELVRKALHRSTQFVKKLYDPFTGANGAAPSATNYTLQKNNGATIDIQTNRLRTGFPATAWIGGAETFVKAFRGQDIDVSFIYTWTPGVEQYDCFYLRTTSADLSGNLRPATGFGIQLNPSSGAFDFFQADNVMKAGNTVAMPSTGIARFRIRILEQTFYLKVWDSTMPEPEAWDFVYTDIRIDTNWGSFTYVHGNGGSATATNTYLDDLIISAAVPPLLPTLATTIPSATRLISGGSVWKLSYTQNFDKTAALGQMRTVYNDMSYSTEEEGDTAFNTTGGRKSANKTMSVANGILDIYQHIEGSTPYGGFIMPDNYTPRTYARYAIRFKTTENTPGQGGYKFVPLMWPSSDDWNEGEIDWPEANIGEYPRPASAVPGSFNTVKPNTMDFRPLAELYAQSDMTDWHIAEMEWIPGAVRFYWDGILVATVTDAVPTKPMRFTLQAETWLTGAAVPAGAAAHVQVDWIAIWDLEA